MSSPTCAGGEFARSISSRSGAIRLGGGVGPLRELLAAVPQRVQTGPGEGLQPADALHATPVAPLLDGGLRLRGRELLAVPARPTGRLHASLHLAPQRRQVGDVGGGVLEHLPGQRALLPVGALHPRLVCIELDAEEVGEQHLQTERQPEHRGGDGGVLDPRRGQPEAREGPEVVVHGVQDDGALLEEALQRRQVVEHQRVDQRHTPRAAHLDERGASVVAIAVGAFDVDADDVEVAEQLQRASQRVRVVGEQRLFGGHGASRGGGVSVSQSTFAAGGSASRPVPGRYVPGMTEEQPEGPDEVARPDVVDRHEYDRWMRTASRHSGLAGVARQAGYPEGAVLHAEQAAQCALKALLHGVGQRAAARGHGLVQLAAACTEFADLEVSDELLSGLRDLATTYLSSRYPDALPDGTPEDHYDDERAARSLAVAGEVIARVPGSAACPRSRPGEWVMTRAAANEAVARRRRDRERLVAEAECFVARLGAELDVRHAVVFGSVARGDFHDESDVDLLIVASRVPDAYPDRLSAVGYPDGSRVEPVVWTPDELDVQRRRGNVIAVEADERGVWLRGGGPC